MKTDWEKLGIKIGSIKDDCESGGTVYAQKAFEEILGEEWIKHAVDKVISCERGSELAMNCLRHIASDCAADYAYKIYKTEENTEKKNMAVWLIKHLAVKKSFDWVEEFLNDSNVIAWGIDVLDQLLWKKIIDYETEKEKVNFLLELAVKNSNHALNICEQIDFIKEYLEERQG